MKKIFENITKHMKLKKKIFIVGFILTLLPAILTTIFFYQNFYQNMMDNVLSSQLTVSYQMKQNVDNMIDNMESVSRKAYIQGLISMLEEDSEVLEDSLQDKSGEYTYFLSTYQAILNSHVSYGSITAVKIYCDNEVLYTNTQSGVKGCFESDSIITDAQWKSLMEEEGISSIVFPSTYLTDYEKTNYGDISYVQKVKYRQQEEEKYAYIVVYYSFSDFMRKISESAVLQGEFAYFIDSRDTFISASENITDVHIAESYEEIRELCGSEQKFVLYGSGNSRIFVSYQEIESIDWRMVWTVPEDTIVGRTKIMFIQMLVVYLSLLALCMVAGSVFANDIFQRIYDLKMQMEKSKDGVFEKITEDMGNDEIGELVDSYCFMIDTIQILMENDRKATEEIAENKIKALQAQMDPHFMYNTLDMIKWMAKSEKNDKVIEAIVALSKYYRLSMNKSNKETTVEEQLKQVEAYMELMNMRFGNSIDYYEDVSDEILSHKIPSVIFQPIIENAIIHGILEKKSQCGVIILAGWKEEKNLCFTISDDGVGMEVENVNLLNEGVGINNSKSGVAITNMKKRLEYMYSNQEKLIEFSSTRGEGTEVVICIPFHDNRDDT